MTTATFDVRAELVELTAERDALPGGGAVSQAEHLLARQRYPDGALQFACRQDSQKDLVLRAQSGAGDANLAAGQRRGRRDRFYARLAVGCCFLAQDAIRETHINTEYKVLGTKLA